MSKQSILEKVNKEKKELDNKIVSLNSFLSKNKPKDFDNKQWKLLKEQIKHMAMYAIVLERRIELLK